MTCKKIDCFHMRVKPWKKVNKVEPLELENGVAQMLLVGPDERHACLQVLIGQCRGLVESNHSRKITDNITLLTQDYVDDLI